MIILIGGNGFIGRHLSCAIHGTGAAFTVVSRGGTSDFLDAHANSGRAMSAEDFQGAPGNDLIRSADTIVYLVNQSVPASFVDQPWRELETNSMPAFRDLVRIAKINPSAHLIYASSGGAVYGHGLGNVAVDETVPVAPISPYGLGKVLGEQILQFVFRTHGLAFDILRISNPIGIWHRNPQQGLVMAAFRAIKSGAPLPIFGDGGQVRDYLDADDLAEAILQVANQHHDGNGIWNVSSGEGHSVMEVIGLVSDVTGLEVPTEIRPARSVDVDKIILDNSQFTGKFGWRPMTSLRSSVEKVAGHLHLGE